MCLIFYLKMTHCERKFGEIVKEIDFRPAQEHVFIKKLL